MAQALPFLDALGAPGRAGAYGGVSRGRIDSLPLWPPLLAARGAGGTSTAHAHHAMHLVVCAHGELKVRAEGRWLRAAGVLTAPDVKHEIQAEGREVLLVFLGPESDAGEALRGVLAGPVRTISGAERAEIVRDAHPEEIMRAGGTAWTRRVIEALGGTSIRSRQAVHPRVRKLLRLLHAMPPDADRSLGALASAVALSPGRLMHAFTASIGLPLRPYLGVAN